MTGTWLGIDTSASPGGVALVADGMLLMESILPVLSLHSEKLLPAVSQLMNSLDIRGEELSGIAISAGPGSYTGLRIGIATAMGLAAGWGVPIKGVSTLRVIVSSLPEDAVLGCVRARKGEIFAGGFQSPSPLSHELIPQGLYSTEELAELLQGKRFLAAGTGRQELPEIPGVLWANPLLDCPRPSLTAFCGAVIAGETGFDTTVEPRYLRDFNQRIKKK